MTRHHHFIDWLKALGMLLILLGHVFGSTEILYNHVSAPIYTKQLGVAFFVFITGWSLANDQRSPMRIVFNRLFPIYFFGLACAISISTIGLLTGSDPNESNYLPFLLGLNVFLDYFPANPTTWYFGLYIHLILFWYFFMAHRKITLVHVLIGVLFEIALRTLLIDLDSFSADWNGKFTAYMILPNWLTPFLLGAYLRHIGDTRWRPQTTLLAISWAGVIALWGYYNAHLEFKGSFPFLTPSNDSTLNVALCSALITALYSLHTLVAFDILRRLPLPKFIAFLARNTLLTVILHMPLIYAYVDLIYERIADPTLKRLVVVAILYLGISLFSEMVNRLVPMKKISNAMWHAVARPLSWADSQLPFSKARRLADKQRLCS